MKIFSGLWLAIIINSLAQALPISDPKEESFVTEIQLNNLIRSLQTSALIAKYSMVFGKPTTTLNQNPTRIPMSRPFASMLSYPFKVRKESKELKEKWDYFKHGTKEFRSKPVTSKPFTYLDLRIIG